MKIRIRTSDLPGRISTGAYILHSGLEKWGADEAHAQGLHAMAAGAFPFLRRIPPMRFGRFLAAGEIGPGAALLNPLVPAGLAGGGAKHLLRSFAGHVPADSGDAPGG